jgi:hypothetical protein
MSALQVGDEAHLELAGLEVEDHNHFDQVEQSDRDRDVDNHLDTVLAEKAFQEAIRRDTRNTSLTCLTQGIVLIKHLDGHQLQ